MDTTLETLPGEGEIKTITKVRMRRPCEECGELAHYKHTFLLKGARSNPASKAYRRDDCSWCEDECQFVCQKHQASYRTSTLDGYEWCATFPASERFAHLFLYWKEIESK
jgi:hypothetical protein